MARPNKYNLKYFPFDVNFFEDHKILMIEEDCSFKGGYIAIRLLAMVYEQGYYLEWEENKEFSIAKRIGNGVSSSLVMDVLSSCFKHRLFDKALFDKKLVLTSKGIQQRWLLVMSQMRRKVDIDSEFWLITSEEKAVSSEETPPTATLSTQKEMKVNKRKLNKNILPDKPVAVKKVSEVKKQKPEEEPEPFWKELVEVWFNFGIQKFNEKPSFERDDPKILKRIVHRLKKRAAEKQAVWNLSTGTRRLNMFLERAFEDKWISQNFLLSNIEKQFDKFIQKQASVQTSSVKRDVEYLFERFAEGALDHQLILPEHFDELLRQSLVQIDEKVVTQRMKALYGSRIKSESDLYNDYSTGRSSEMVKKDYPNLQRISVLQYFTSKKNQKKWMTQISSE